MARAVNSVLAKTVQDVEVNVVDDGSDDGVAVVKEIDDPLDPTDPAGESGDIAGEDRRIEMGRVGLVVFLDADDEWLPGHLEVLLRL
ncbi:glycosyltransferase [Methanoculleus sp.]|uniref:glycosyltransferase n=1 Tax=Methanoculleus sp. TaxID=90427 RepID=UPI0025CE17FE|nr:glycosyltransferase [Methanoculleus sp.]